MVELNTAGDDGDAAGRRPAPRRARPDDPLAQPARLQRLGHRRPGQPRQDLGGRPPGAAARSRRDQRARPRPRRARSRSPTTWPSSSATSTTRTAPWRPTRAPTRTPAAGARPDTPAWRGSSTTSTTRRSRSTSTTRSATSCTSRSSRSATGPCADYNAGEYDPDGPGPQEPQPGVPNLDGSAATTERPRGEPLRRLARRQPAGPQRGPEPAALRPLGLPGGLRRPRALQPGGSVDARPRPGQPRPRSARARLAGRRRRGDAAARRRPVRPGRDRRRHRRLDRLRRRHRLRCTARAPTLPGPRARKSRPPRTRAASPTTSPTASALPPSTTQGLPRGGGSGTANSDLLGYLFGT